MSLLEQTDTAAALVLSIDQEGVGGVTGKAPIVRIRDASTTDSYLDWADLTFKALGWTTLDGVMTEIDHNGASDGHYQRSLDVSAVAAMVPGFAFVAEYSVDDGGDVIGDSSETFEVVSEIANIPTAALIADAVWDELLAGHVIAGSSGSALTAAGAGAIAPATIASAVWNAATSSYQAAGSFGAALGETRVLVDNQFNVEGE